MTKEEQTLLKTWFEQNFLDGDKIQGGQMISSAKFFEAMCDAVSFLKNSQSEKQKEESLITKDQAKKAFIRLVEEESAFCDNEYSILKQYLENSQPTISSSSLGWDEIYERFYRMNIAAKLTYEEIVDFFKHHFLSIQQDNDKAYKEITDWNIKYDSLFDEAEKYKQRAEKAEHRVKELEAVHPSRKNKKNEYSIEKQIGILENRIKCDDAIYKNREECYKARIKELEEQLKS